MPVRPFHAAWPAATRRAWQRALTALALAASAALAATGDEPVQRWMQSLHDDWAVPRHERLQAHTRDLAEAVARTCGEPAPGGPALQAARRAWHDSLLTWRQLEALQLGPTLARRTSKSIDFWPTRPAVIDKAAQMTADLPVSGPQAEQAMMQWGSAAKGLPALEWLLFPGGGTAAPVTRDAALCRYAQRLSLALAGEAAQLHAAWRDEAGRWHVQPPPARRALSDTLNLFIGSIELLRGKKLAKGAEMQARVRAGGAQAASTKGLDAFDSLRSGSTREMLWAHADALAQLLLGRTPGLAYTREAPALGLDDLLVLRGHAREAAALAPAVRRMRQALQALPADTRQWTPARVRSAAESLAALRRAIDPAVAQALDVTITFTDADGD
jgi:predicted lipoprotein